MQRKNLKFYRVKKGLKQSEVAAMIGISSISYCNLERGNTNGTFETWAKIGKTLEIPDEEMWRVMWPKENG